MTRAPAYTHGHHPAVLRSHEWRTAENSAAYLLPYLRAGDHLLDVGCGPGTITADLAERVAPGRVIGLDQAVGVLTQARAVAAEWLALYRTLARMNGGEPDAARHLLSWAQRAGFTDVTTTASTWCFATPPDRAWWGGMWSERIVDSGIADQAVQSGLATRDDLARMSTAWQEWSEAADGWFAIVHGEIVCRA